MVEHFGNKPKKEMMHDRISDNYIPHGEKNPVKIPKKWRFVWTNVIFFSLTHIVALYGIYLCFTKAMWPTIFFAYVLSTLSNIGVTAGAHRMWTHRAYKAKLPLQIINAILHTMAYQGSVHRWVRDHRTHHKFCDTNADPHNSRRGFFFSHIGWLILKKHPDVITMGRTIDMSDIENDPILRVQRKYYYLWMFIFCIAIPAYIPLLWGEDQCTSFVVAVVLRHTYALHLIFCVNSVAHMWGTKPYDKNIFPVENKVIAFFSSGEGFHNFHHSFPWDYKTDELGEYMFSTSSLYIDLMAKIGWAYDLKTVSEELVQKRVMRSGDGSHPVWGWLDRDFPVEEKHTAKLLY